VTRLVADASAIVDQLFTTERSADLNELVDDEPSRCAVVRPGTARTLVRVAAVGGHSHQESQRR
jgi:hypothetical protein